MMTFASHNTDNNPDKMARDAFFTATLLELEELISRRGPIKNKNVKHILNFWPWFSIYQIESAFDEQKTASEEVFAEETNMGRGEATTFPQVVRIKNGWKILDYGDGLITSAGEDYGSFSFSTSRLLNTVECMMVRLSTRLATQNVKKVNFAGALPAKRYAWLRCKHYGWETAFAPQKDDFQRQENLARISRNYSTILSL
jgi:hypothetical protein